MDETRDPVQARDDGSLDLYEVSGWEVRSGLDRFAVGLYHAAIGSVRWAIVSLAVLILVAQFAIGGLGLLENPIVGTFVVLSVAPAFVLAAYLWYADVTTQEPLETLVVTFILGLLLASFAGILNEYLGGIVAGVGSGFGAFPTLGLIAFFVLVVGPGEEAVKLLAVRLHAYRTERFNAVIDGAVYGAVAGLGFATIENALYITQQLQTLAPSADFVGATGEISTIRALAGPGHVIYSAFAGYYLGLAKFNPEHRGPLVVKGLVIAALIHAMYNIMAAIGVPIAAELFGVGQLITFIGFVVLYDGAFIYLLVRKLSRYNSAYRQLTDSDPGTNTAVPSE